MKDPRIDILLGDCREVLSELEDESVHCVITSPPYWGLRDYGTAKWEGGDADCDHSKPHNMSKSGLEGGTTTTLNNHFFRQACKKCGARRVDNQIGLEDNFQDYIAKMVAVFREVRRVLRKDGTLWLNLGDSYAANRSYQVRDNKHTEVGNNMPMSVPDGLKPKDLCGIPWRVAFALQADGWYLRSDIIWSKPNPMPESVTDRPTKAHEYLFLLTKSERYYYDAEAIKEESTRPEMLGRVNGHFGVVSDSSVSQSKAVNVYTSHRNRRSVWEITTAPYSEAHFATFPPALVEPCIKAGTSERGCCTKCGAPWVRQTEKGEPIQQHWAPGTQAKIDIAQGKHGATSVMNTGFTRPLITIGFSPSCSCNAKRKRCVVLDPFGGAGTVGLVAERLGRNSILIELNDAYVTMAEKRLRNSVGLLGTVVIS